MRALIVLSFLSLGACATTGGYEQMLNTWVGSSEDSLVQTWGPPTSTYDMGAGKKVLTYMHGGGTTSTYNPYLNMSFTSNNYCKTDFYLDSLSTVKSWRWEGNQCRAIRKAADTTISARP